VQRPAVSRLWEHRWLAAILAVAAVGLGVRLTALDQGFWFDEVVSISTAGEPMGELLFRAAFYDAHTPLYYALLRGWTALFGTAEWAVRLLSLLFSAGTLLLVGLWARPRGGWSAFLAVGLLSVSTFHVHYSVEARAFCMVAFLVTAWLMLLERLERSRDARLPAWVLAGAVQSLMVLSSGYTLPLVVAANIHFYTARRRSPARLLRWSLVQTWSIALCSTWLPALMIQWFRFPAEPASVQTAMAAASDLLMYLGISTVHPSYVVGWLGTLLPLAAAGIAMARSFGAERRPNAEPDDADSARPLSFTARLHVAAAMLASLLGPVAAVLLIPTTESTMSVLVGELARGYFVIIGALFLVAIGPLVNRSVVAAGHGVAAVPFVLLLGTLLLAALFCLHRPFPPRQVLFLAPPILVLAATAWVPSRMLGKAAVCALALALAVPSLMERNKAFEPRQDLRAAAAFVTERVPFQVPEQPVLVIPMWDRPALEYYFGADRAEGVMKPQQIASAARKAQSVTLVLTREAFDERKAFRDSAGRLLGPRFHLKETGQFRGVYVAHFVRSTNKGVSP